MTRSTWFRAAVTLAVLAWLVSLIDVAEAGRAILRLSPAAALAVAILLAVDRAVVIWRWIILLRATGHTVLVKSAAWIYLVSSFVGSFTPAGIGADVARAYTLGRRTSQANEAVASVAVDRVLGLLAILLVGIVSGAIWGARYGVTARGPLAVLGVATLAAAVAVLFADQIVRLVIPNGHHGAGLSARVLRLADAVSAYRGHRGSLAAVLALSIGVQLLRILQAWLLGVGLGIDVPFTYYLMFMSVALITLLLPISVMGFGLPQAGIVYMLALRGVAEADAFALSTLIVLSGIVANLPGALLYLRSRR